MAKWRVSVEWEGELDADDEGMALIDASIAFDFMCEARAELIEPEDVGQESEGA